MRAPSSGADGGRPRARWTSFAGSALVAWVPIGGLSMPDTRRVFLRCVSGTAGAVAYLRSAAATPQRLREVLAVAPEREAFWNLVASQFPLRAGKIPMN